MDFPRCVQCDYDLREHQPAVYCPECGFRYDVAERDIPAHEHRLGHDLTQLYAASIWVMVLLLYVGLRFTRNLSPLSFAYVELILVAGAILAGMFCTNRLLRHWLTCAVSLRIEEGGLRRTFTNGKSVVVPWSIIARLHTNQFAPDHGTRLEYTTRIGLNWYLTYRFDLHVTQVDLVLKAIERKVQAAKHS